MTGNLYHVGRSVLRRRARRYPRSAHNGVVKNTFVTMLALMDVVMSSFHRTYDATSSSVQKVDSSTRIIAYGVIRHFEGQSHATSWCREVSCGRA